MSSKQQPLTRLQAKDATIGIIGLGYVGLPLAVSFAQAGCRVLGVDVDSRKIELIQQGHSYIEDIASEALAPFVAAKTLSASTDYAPLAEADAVIICVPTPLNNTKDPDLKYIHSATDSLCAVITPATLVVLESTTYPGTTVEVVKPRLEASGLTVGEALFLAFSGERIDPGNETYGIRNTPKVIGGVDEDSIELAQALYSLVVDTVVPVSSTTTAEMVKLLENTFRAVNIALANEVAIMCDKLEIDVWEVVQAAATKPFGFMPFYPGPGVGGHCIPIDSHYLGWKMRQLNYQAQFIELANRINDDMPQYVVSKIADALNSVAKPIRGSRIVILGVAYKPNINDVRESPALYIIELLQQKGGEVVYHDPHVADVMLHNGIQMSTVEYSEALLAEADCVVIVTNHKSYDWVHVKTHSPLVVDTRHVYPTDQNDETLVSL